MVQGKVIDAWINTDHLGILKVIGIVRKGLAEPTLFRLTEGFIQISKWVKNR